VSTSLKGDAWTLTNRVFETPKICFEKDAQVCRSPGLSLTPTQEGVMSQSERWLSAYHILHQRFGKPPSDSDIAWRLLNQDLIVHGVAGNWALYRQTRFRMAELLHAEGKSKAALLTYFEVCYLDLNGAQDHGRCVHQPHASMEFPAPIPEKGELTGTLFERCLELVGSLHLNGPDSRAWFYRAAARPYGDLRLPVDPQGAWRRLKRKLRFPVGSA
jgi:hypothetical protein